MVDHRRNNIFPTDIIHHRGPSPSPLLLPRQRPIGPVNLAMAPETKDEPLRRGSFLEPGAPETPAIHPSFIQVAKPYIFEQTIQDCIEAMGVNPMREESLRLQGVTWIDNVRRVLRL